MMADILTKIDMAKELASKIDFVNQEQAKTIIDTFLDDIISNIASGKKIQFKDFGSFEKKHRAATSGRNPKTGEAIDIAARDFPKFTVGKKFKEVVNS